MEMNAAEINKFFYEFYKLDQTTHSYNPFLRISKPTKSKLVGYEKNRFNSIFYRFTIFKLFFPIIAVRHVVTNVIYNLAAMALHRRPVSKTKKVDVVFLSHLTNRNVSFQTDTFFGDLPKELKKLEMKMAIIYSNQSRKLPSSLLKKIEEKNNTVVSKYLKWRDLIFFIQCAMNSIKFTLGRVKNNPRKYSEEEFLIVKAMISFLSREAMMNFNLIEKTKNAIAKYQPRYVFLTAEGHVYENSIYLNCKADAAVRKVFMVQNSPIVASQFGFFDFIKQNQDKLTFLVQGTSYMNMILELNDSVEVINIGKKSMVLRDARSISRQRKLLLIPDGDKLNIKYQLSLTNYLFKEVCSNISISLHPDTNIGFFNLVRIKYLRRKGLVKELLSNINQEDLQQFSIIVYTSSSLAIQSLSWGKELIHVSESEYNIDPLWLLADKNRPVVKRNRRDLTPITYSESDLNFMYSDLDYKPLFKVISHN
jgi:hypothetical protein